MPSNDAFSPLKQPLSQVDAVVFGVWANVLRRTPRSVLWLLAMPADAARSLVGAR
jgi:predicted O-linked N-acetylglucosamine transferase (SPINDLY family)